MGGAEQILAGVKAHADAQELLDRSFYSGPLGFLMANVPEPSVPAVGRATLIGFGVKGWQLGTRDLEILDDQENPMRPLTMLSEIPKELRTIARQGKGVGPRFYNSPQALRGTAEDPKKVGMYEFNISLGALHHMGSKPSGTRREIARQAIHYASQLAEEKVRGIDAVVRRVHRAQGPVDAVMYNQTIDARRREKELGVVTPVPEQLLIVRRSTVLPKLIGTYTQPK